MRPETRFGTFEELIAGIDPEGAEIAHRLRSIIIGIHPAAVEVVRLGDRAATYGVGPKKTTEAYTYIMPQQPQVNLGFFHGPSLPDPEGLLEGTGKAMRHVKVRTLEEAERPAIRLLLEAALAERRTALGLVG
jgi:hypothetical protein